MTTKPKKALLSLKDVARHLKVSERTVYSWLRAGTLSGIRLPGKYLFSHQDLTDFLQKRRPGSPGQETR